MCLDYEYYYEWRERQQEELARFDEEVTDQELIALLIDNMDEYNPFFARFQRFYSVKAMAYKILAVKYGIERWQNLEEYAEYGGDDEDEKPKVGERVTDMLFDLAREMFDKNFYDLTKDEILVVLEKALVSEAVA